VLAQSPAAGGSVHAGQKVELTVAKAPKEITVPEVEGAAQAAAAAHLKDAGFTSKVVSVPSTEPAQVGVVLKQSPAAGTKARKGATVTLTVGAQLTTTTPPSTTPTTTTTTTTTAPPSTPPATE